MKIEIDKKFVNVTRKRLREWLALEKLREQILKEKDKKETIFQYLKLGTDKSDWENVFWLTIQETLSGIQEENRISFDLPMFASQERKEGSVPWEYDSRLFYTWANSFARAYGWSLEEIENLDPDDACALLQEIYVSEQLEKEFQYSLSEIAYPYNSSTKKSKFKPLSRPTWMSPKPKKVKKHKFLKSMLPMGEIINIGEITDEVIESTRGFSDT